MGALPAASRRRRALPSRPPPDVGAHAAGVGPPRSHRSRPRRSRVPCHPAWPAPACFCLLQSGHTILLLQSTPAAASRTYLDFDSLGKALDAVTRMFEDRLKELTPGARNITYDVHDLFRFLDNLHDISALA